MNRVLAITVFLTSALISVPSQAADSALMKEYKSDKLNKCRTLNAMAAVWSGSWKDSAEERGKHARELTDRLLSVGEQLGIPPEQTLAEGKRYGQMLDTKTRDEAMAIIKTDIEQCRAKGLFK